MSAQSLEQAELLLLILSLFVDKLFNQLLQVRLLAFSDEALLEENLLDQTIDIRATDGKDKRVSDYV